MAGLLAEHDVTVLSGLARGIDTAAHEETLAQGGRTIAVLGTGILRSYPKENSELAERIVQSGALVSQFWPSQPPTTYNFPRRNVVTSGMSQGTVVIEASETSGAKMQARRALEHGKRVFLVSRLVTSRPWAQKYVENRGAIEIRTVDDVLARLRSPTAVEQLSAGRQQLHSSSPGGDLCGGQVAERCHHWTGLLPCRSRWTGRLGAQLLRAAPPLSDPLPVPMAAAANMNAIANDPAVARLARNDKLGGGKTVSARFLRTWIDYTPAIEPEAPRVPLLLAHPAADRWTPTELSERFLRRLAGPTQLVTLDHCGHFPPEEPGLTQLEAVFAAFAAKIGNARPPGRTV